MPVFTHNAAVEPCAAGTLVSNSWFSRRFPGKEFMAQLPHSRGAKRRENMRMSSKRSAVCSMRWLRKPENLWA